jgi:mannitol 2-dehydrogenase
VTHPTPTPLSDKTVGELDATVDKPAYDRSKLTTGIVHFGVGGFHRAHQAMYLDALMNEGKALDWALCGVGVLPHDRRIVDTLTSQDGLYTLVVKHPDGRREPRVIGSIATMLFAPDDPQAVVDLLADERTRIASLTITEGGYLVNQVTGEFDATDPSIQADLRADFASGGSPTTAFGYLTAALHQRRRDGRPPFTVMSCDNLPDNGDVAKRMLCAFARLKDPELADWMEAEVPFPNCMVDRITPVTTPEDIERLGEEFGVADGWPVVCEPFTQWVLEDDFVPGRPPYEDAGVQVVEDVEPYELMKLRLLNASHQALAYFAYLSGYRLVHEAAQEPAFRAFLLGYMDQEATPTLEPVPGVDLRDYKHTLIERFSNPEVRDTVARLCAESSDRIPKWLLPVVRRNVQTGGELRRSAAIVASWARYAEGVDEQGEPIEVVDQLADQLIPIARRQREEPLAFIANRELFGDVIDDERFVAAYRAALRSLHERGARATLESLTS